MAQNDIRTDGRPVTVEHHSSRGKVTRNAGNFTRGSQLISHELLMWLAGVKMPILLFGGVFLLAYIIILMATLDENNFQLICMKILAELWDWTSLDPHKEVNLKLPDNSVHHTIMGLVTTHYEVVRAWSKAMRGLIGATLISIFTCVPLAIWFVDFSKKRGKAILQERHERGAMLVDRDTLFDEISRHNRHQFEGEINKLFPGKSAPQVLALPFSERKEAGLHHPYSLGGVPYPYRLEQSHTMLIGTTGSGKTTELRSLVSQIRKREDTAVIFDLTGSYVESFYNPETDTILNPMDTRCPQWSIFDDCRTHSEFTSAAAALIPSDGDSSEPFWALAARTLFIEMCMKLIEKGLTTNKALADNLMTADLKRVHRYLANTIADPLTAPEAARMAESIRAVFNTNAQVLRFLPDSGPRFSIKKWMTEDKKPGSILFITSNYNDLVMNKALLTLWNDLAIHSIMTMPRTRHLRTWFLFDELGALHRLPAIEIGLQTARAYGGAMVLGLHSFEKLIEVYGEQGAKNLASLARSKLILATADLDTAEQCARYIGNREVRQMDEAYSYGANSTRDAATLTPRKQIEPLVIADDITNLPSLNGFVKFPDGFPAARIKLEYKDYPKVAEGFLNRPYEPPRAKLKQNPPVGQDEGGEAGGRDGSLQIVEEVFDAHAGQSAVNDLFAEKEGPQADDLFKDQEYSNVIPLHGRHSQIIDSEDKKEAITEPSQTQDKAHKDISHAKENAPDIGINREEDLNLTELRQGFGIEQDDDGMGM